MFTREIVLTQGQKAIVDASDYEWLTQWKWFAHWEKHTQSFYACRSTRDENGVKGTVWMHRQILGLVLKDGKIGDHIETTQTLNNCRSNLRVATPGESVRNRRKNSNNKCGIRGVSLNNGTYLVRITVDKKPIYVGRRRTLEDAALLYAEASKKYHGEFGRT